MANLQKEIRQRINRLAHRQALQYENEARNSLLAHLKEIADSGATLNKLSQTLAKIEAQPHGKPL